MPINSKFYNYILSRASVNSQKDLKLIGHEDMIMMTPERWWESTGKALDLLKRCGVETLMYRGKIGDVKNMFNGSEGYP